MRYLASVLLVTVAAMWATAEEPAQKTAPTAADYFSRAPIDVASGLAEYSRLDMIDYFNHGSAVKTENRLGQKVSLKSLTPEMLTYQDDDSIATTIAVLPGAKTDTVLMVIRTVPLPAHDSSISYYDKRWQQIEGKTFPSPTFTDWLRTNDRSARSDVEDALPFMISSATYDPETKTLTIANTAEDFFVASDKPAALKHLKDKLKYRWNGRKFELLKNE